MGQIDKSPVTLLSNAAATGAGVKWPGGRGNFGVDGTFSGSTVQLEALGPDGTNYVLVGTDVQLTAEGMGNFELPEGLIRAAVSGGPPSGIYAVAKPV